MGRLWTVVAGKDDNRVLFDACFLDRVQNLSSAVVHLGQTIGPIAVARFASERSTPQLAGPSRPYALHRCIRGQRRLRSSPACCQATATCCLFRSATAIGPRHKCAGCPTTRRILDVWETRSEERLVGKEGRCRWEGT